MHCYDLFFSLVIGLAEMHVIARSVMHGGAIWWLVGQIFHRSTLSPFELTIQPRLSQTFASQLQFGPSCGLKPIETAVNLIRVCNSTAASVNCLESDLFQGSQRYDSLSRKSFNWTFTKSS